MRKKLTGHNYDAVARVVGRGLLAELLNPHRMPDAPALRFESGKQIEKRLEGDSVVFFYIDASGSSDIIAAQSARPFYARIKAASTDSQLIPAKPQFISGTATTRWRLETGETLIVIKVLAPTDSA